MCALSGKHSGSWQSGSLCERVRWYCSHGEYGWKVDMTEKQIIIQCGAHIQRQQRRMKGSCMLQKKKKKSRIKDFLWANVWLLLPAGLQCLQIFCIMSSLWRKTTCGEQVLTPVTGYEALRTAHNLWGCWVVCRAHSSVITRIVPTARRFSFHLNRTFIMSKHIFVPFSAGNNPFYVCIL